MEKLYEIFWSDLTKEAQEKFKDLYDANFDVFPFAIVSREEPEEE